MISDLNDESASNVTLSKSWAIGGTNTRAGENTDNAKYYATQASSSKTAASNSATAAANSATTAGASATAAQAAQTAAETAQGKAEDAQAAAEAAAQTLVIDPTLTQPNQAAEAKATGDAISLVKSQLDDIGAYSTETPAYQITYNKAISANGSIIDNAGATFGITNMIPVDGYELFIITTTVGYGLLLYAFYDANGTFISGLPSASNGYTTITDRVVRIPTGATQIRVGKTNNPFAVKGALRFALDIEPTVKTLQDKISAFPTKSVYSALAFTNIGVKYINASGEIVDAVGDTYYITGYVDVSEHETIYVTASGNWGNVLYAFYDNSHNVVQLGTASASSGSFTSITREAVSVPSNAKYVVVAGRTTAVMPNIEILSEYAEIGKWNGKKWVCVGDSLTEVNAATSKHYFDYVADVTDITVVNMGVSGTGYARRQDENKAFYQRISNCPTDADVVTIFGSFNDLGAGLPIGSVDDTGTDTLAGCINTTITNLQTIIPLVNLGIVAPTPWDTTQPSTSGQAFNYVEMLKAICARRSIPFLDLWRESNLRPWDANFRTVAYSHDGGSGTHPDENGHKLIAPRFKGFLETLLL